MGIEDLIQAQPGESGLGRSRLDHPMEFWGAPLAAAESCHSAIIREKEDSESAKSVEHAAEAVKKNYFGVIVASVTNPQPHQILIAATVLLAAFGMAALASMWSSAGEKVAALSPPAGQAVQSAQSAPEGSGQRASAISISSADPSVAVGWPDVAANTAETPAVASTAANRNTALQETGTATQKEDIVFLQRSGVHIRSAPSTNGRVLATVPKGTRFKVTNREGDWVQVESDRFNGWIRSRFLAANEP
jgi:hypothetical protein